MVVCKVRGFVYPALMGLCVAVLPAAWCDVSPGCGCFGVAGLEGAWTGTLTADACKAFSNTGPADINDPGATVSAGQFPLSVTFARDGTPDKLLFIAAPMESLPMEAVEISALQQGQTLTVDLENRTCQVIAKEVSYSRDHMRVVLEAEVLSKRTQFTNTTWSQITALGSTMQTIEAAPAADGSGLIWTQVVYGTAHIETVHHLRADDATIEGESWEAYRVDAAAEFTAP